MFDVNILFISAWLCLSLAIALQWLGWLKQIKQLSNISGYIIYLSMLLLAIALGWHSWQVAHLPPISFNEVLFVFTLLTVGLGLVIVPSGKIIPSISGVLPLFLLGWGGYHHISQPFYLGREGLWMVMLVSKWFILSGLSALYWLSIMAICAWYQNPPLTVNQNVLLESKDDTTDNVHKNEFKNELSQLETKKLFLQMVTTLAFVVGIPLFLVGSWWRGSYELSQSNSLIGFGLLLTARWWLRFNNPPRPKWEWLLTVISFGVGVTLILRAIAT